MFLSLLILKLRHTIKDSNSTHVVLSEWPFTPHNIFNFITRCAPLLLFVLPCSPSCLLLIIPFCFHACTPLFTNCSSAFPTLGAPHHDDTIWGQGELSTLFWVTWHTKHNTIDSKLLKPNTSICKWYINQLDQFNIKGNESRLGLHV